MRDLAATRALESCRGNSVHTSVRRRTVRWKNAARSAIRQDIQRVQYGRTFRIGLIRPAARSRVISDRDFLPGPWFAVPRYPWPSHFAFGNRDSCNRALVGGLVRLSSGHATRSCEHPDNPRVAPCHHVAYKHSATRGYFALRPPVVPVPIRQIRRYARDVLLVAQGGGSRAGALAKRSTPRGSTAARVIYGRRSFAQKSAPILIRRCHPDSAGSRARAPDDLTAGCVPCAG